MKDLLIMAVFGAPILAALLAIIFAPRRGWMEQRNPFSAPRIPAAQRNGLQRIPLEARYNTASALIDQHQRGYRFGKN